MSSKSIMAYLRDLCADMDAGRPLKPYLRKAAIPAAFAIGIAGASGCSSGQDQPRNPNDRPTTETQCDDGVDDDADGFVDCSDDDCQEWTGCHAVVEYGAPVEDEPPEPVPAYGVPYEPEPQIQSGGEPEPVDMYAEPFA